MVATRSEATQSGCVRRVGLLFRSRSGAIAPRARSPAPTDANWTAAIRERMVRASATPSPESYPKGCRFGPVEPVSVRPASVGDTQGASESDGQPPDTRTEPPRIQAPASDSRPKRGGGLSCPNAGNPYPNTIGRPPRLDDVKLAPGGMDPDPEAGEVAVPEDRVPVNWLESVHNPPSQPECAPFRHRRAQPGMPGFQSSNRIQAT